MQKDELWPYKDIYIIHEDYQQDCYGQMFLKLCLCYFFPLKNRSVDHTL